MEKSSTENATVPVWQCKNCGQGLSRCDECNKKFGKQVIYCDWAKMNHYCYKCGKKKDGK